MKLLKLRIKHLNSFRSEIELDFETAPLSDTSLIAISGPTGAGKTTLLDALCVALYNKTPRLSGVGNQNPGNLLSQGKAEGFAEVLFEARGSRYLAEWRIKRGQNGAFKSEVKLINAETGDLITDRFSSRGESHGTSAMTVSDAVECILGLDFGAFNRSVMLAQGDFAAFLKAKPEERRRILEVTTGIGIYDKLKQTLNKKVDETEQAYNQITGTFGAIPTVTDEEIEVVRSELFRLEASTESLQARRSEILENWEAERHRSHLFAQLTAAEARQQELLSEQSKMDIERSGLELARKAARLIPERDKLQSQREEFELLQEQIKKTDEVLGAALPACNEAQKTFRKVDEAYHGVLLTREMKIDSYNEALAEEIHADAQSKAAEKREIELTSIESRIEGLLNTAASQDEDRSVLVKDIHRDRLFLQQHALHEDSNHRVNQLTRILEKFNAKSAFLTDKLKTQNQSRLKIAQLENVVTTSERELDKCLEEKVAADARFVEMESAVKVQWDGATVEVWQAQKHQAVLMQSVSRGYEQVQELLNEKRAELDLICDTLDSVEVELASIDQAMVTQIEVVARIEEKVKRYTVEIELARALNHVIKLRDQLREGESCPVCGATEHRWVGKVGDESQKQREGASFSLSLAESELDAENRKTQNLEQNRIRNDEKQSNFQNRSSEARKKIESLEKTIDAAHVKWRETYPQREISSKWTQGIIDVADESIHRFQELMNLHTGAWNDERMASQRFNEQEREIYRTKTALADAASQEQTVNAEVEGLNQHVAVLETEFWGLLPHNLRADRHADALRHFAGHIKMVKARQEQLIAREYELDQLDSEIGQNQRNLEAEREIAVGVDLEIGRHRLEAQRLSAAAQKKTEGLSAAAAVRELETKVTENMRLRAQTEKELRNKEKLLTQAQTKRDNFECQHTECVEKVDAVQRDYLEALGNSGFESPEDHLKAFRDESWVHARGEELAEYQRQLHTTEETIRHLRLFFVDQPFNPELVIHLKETGQAIDLEVETANQNIGHFRENIKKLKGDFHRREALSGALDKAHQEKARWAQLHACIPHNRLRDFALERMFELIIRLANTQLEGLTQRYALRVKGIDEMVVSDRWNANEERPVETLSGGEAFLTSLSLALALSEVSRGRTQLNSLYLDEGFGTLDSQTLDVAISALEALQISGRSVTVISHVSELTRRIPVRIAVEKLGNGSSRVKVRG